MRQPTVSMSPNGLSLSKCIPEKLGDTLNFSMDLERKEIIINRTPGEHMVLVTYPTTQPVIKSMPLIKWIKNEFGDCNYSKMPVSWNEEEGKFIVKPGVKA